MDETGSTFRVVLRGYEPAQVNRRVEELAAAVARITTERDELAAQVAAERERPAGEPAVVEPPSFEQLGARVGQILALAREEADELRRTAQEEIAAERGRLEQDAARIREEADRYAADTRSTAETEATRIVEDARRAADERLDGAERDAAARIQDAEALYEEQRAKSVQAAADFENTLAARRKAAEDDFTQRMGEVEQRLDEARQTLETARADAERVEADARRRADDLVRDAEQRSKAIVDEADATAARLRAESDRELAAATQRRDAINTQLGNVRQMLASLTGSVAAPASHSDEALDEPVVETHDEAADETAGSGVEAR